MDTQFPVLCSTKPLKAGSENFQRIPITTNVFKLGRGNHNTFVIPNKCLSKDHCIFKKVEEEWVLENCSYTKIKVNGNKIRKGETQKLSDQDIIKLDVSNELVYTFTCNARMLRKRRKLDDLPNVRKKSVSPKSDTQKLDTQTVKDKILSEQFKRDKDIYDDYATRIEKLKGSKKVVKRQKTALKVRRNELLENSRIKMEEKMASLMAQQTKNENQHSKEQLKQSGCGDQRGSKENLDQSAARREQDRIRMKEKKELKKLRRETRRLKLDKERKLKELEKQKLRRENALQDELDKVNKKLAKERELREKEKRRVEQLLNQKKEELKKVSLSTSSGSKLDMESELQCSICSELFVRATTLGCSHSFCRYCIRKWTANKKECPICRAPITSECRSIVLDSLVDKMADTAHAKRKREQLVKARDDMEAKESTLAVPNRANPYNTLTSILPEFMYDNSSRESSLGPEDFSPLTDTDTDMSEPDAGYEWPSDEERAQDVDEDAPEDYEDGEDHDGNSTEHYEVAVNSASENGEQEDTEDGTEESTPDNYNYSEGNDSESENYDAAYNSAPDEDENSTPEYEGDENSAPEYDEDENSAPEYEGDENSAPEYEGDENSAHEYEGDDNSAPEYGGDENSAPEYGGDENSAPEYDGDENSTVSEPENYGEHSEPEYEEHSGPENYEEPGDSDGENSAQEYDEASPHEFDGNSYPDDDGDEDYGDYY